MKARETIVLIAMLAGGVLASAQTELRIEPANRTLTVSAQGEVSVDADVAILHIGFETQRRPRQPSSPRSNRPASPTPRFTASGSGWTAQAASRTSSR